MGNIYDILGETRGSAAKYKTDVDSQAAQVTETRKFRSLRSNIAQKNKIINISVIYKCIFESVHIGLRAAGTVRISINQSSRLTLHAVSVAVDVGGATTHSEMYLQKSGNRTCNRPYA